MPKELTLEILDEAIKKQAKKCDIKSHRYFKVE